MKPDNIFKRGITYINEIFENIRNFLFGYDFFISYAHEDGKEYPEDLYSSLKKLGYSVYLDNQENKVGEKLTSIIKVRISNSKHLIVIGSPYAISSSFWVYTEVDTFEKLQKAPIIINISKSIEGAREKVKLDGIKNLTLLFWLDQNLVDLKGGTQKDNILYINDGEVDRLPKTVGESTLVQIAKTFVGRRREIIRFRLVSLALVCLIGLSIAAIFTAIFALDKQEEAEMRLNDAIAALATENFTNQPIKSYKMLLSTLGRHDKIKTLSKTQKQALSSMLPKLKISGVYSFAPSPSCGMSQVFKISEDENRFLVSKHRAIEIIDNDSFKIISSKNFSENVISMKHETNTCPYISAVWAKKDSKIFVIKDNLELIAIDSVNLEIQETYKIPKEIQPYQLVSVKNHLFLIGKFAIYSFKDAVFSKLYAFEGHPDDWGQLVATDISQENNRILLLWKFQLIVLDFKTQDLLCQIKTNLQFNSANFSNPNSDSIPVVSLNMSSFHPDRTVSVNSIKISEKCLATTSILDFASDIEWVKKLGVSHFTFIAADNYPTSKLYIQSQGRVEEVPLPALIFNDAISITSDKNIILLHSSNGEIFKIDLSTYFPEQKTWYGAKMEFPPGGLSMAPYTNQYPEKCEKNNCFGHFAFSADKKFLATAHAAPSTTVPQRRQGGEKILVWDTKTQVKLIEISMPNSFRGFQFVEQEEKMFFEVISGANEPVFRRTVMSSKESISNSYLCDLLPLVSYGNSINISNYERISPITYPTQISICD